MYRFGATTIKSAWGNATLTTMLLLKHADHWRGVSPNCPVHPKLFRNHQGFIQDSEDKQWPATKRIRGFHLCWRKFLGRRNKV